MARNPPKATLASSKGADLLADLKKRLEPQAPTPARVRASSQTQNGSIEENLKAALARRAGQPPRQHNQAPRPKPKRDKNKEYIKIGDPALRREVIAEVKKIGVQNGGSSRSPSGHNDLGEADFDKLKMMAGRMNGFSATHIDCGPKRPSDEETITRRIELGAVRVEGIVDADDGFFLGYDFGTSTTKAVARYPYGGVDNAFAIEVPGGFGAGQPHLWPTAIWFDHVTKRFSLIPAENLACLDSFKTALIGEQAHRMTKAGVTAGHAAVAFLALHLAYCIGAALEQEPKFKLAGINVGTPVATLKHAPGIAMFERVLNAALFLVPVAPSLTLADVQSAFETERPARLPYALHTELAGAIAGYCSMLRPYVGGHMIIDCGSATLDMATFALDGVDLRPIAIYDARVEQLGADACSVYQRDGASFDECRRASRYQEHLVYKKTREFSAAPFVQREGRYPYQIILVGGGIHSHVHEPLFGAMENAFHRPFHRPQLAPGLRYDANCEAGRLILADGLARDPIDLRKVAMPGDPPPRRDCLPDMITKDQM